MKDIKEEEILEDLDEIGDKIVMLRGALLELLDLVHDIEKYVGGESDDGE